MIVWVKDTVGSSPDILLMNAITLNISGNHKFRAVFA